MHSAGHNDDFLEKRLSYVTPETPESPGSEPLDPAILQAVNANID